MEQSPNEMHEGADEVVGEYVILILRSKSTQELYLYTSK